VAEGFSCSLVVFHEGIEIRKMQFFDKKWIFFSSKICLNLTTKTLDSDPGPHLDARRPKMLDPDPH
jgi:hypothetical protein